FIPKDRNEPAESGEVVYEHDLYPADKEEERVELFAAPAIRRQMKDLLLGITEGKKTVCPIEEGAISSASCILGNMSMSLGRTLEWDPETWTVVNDDEANALLARGYREGWVHP
ncbi:MAG: gfo/Idh/MocA family oxidoreductase, partial [Thermoguttaceae bacterium]|nr:gfo/Idh/MocA family oxidoreductase [Thermoguttaceae bacterium]